MGFRNFDELFLYPQRVVETNGGDQIISTLTAILMQDGVVGDEPGKRVFTRDVRWKFQNWSLEFGLTALVQRMVRAVASSSCSRSRSIEATRIERTRILEQIIGTQFPTYTTGER